MIKGNDEYLGDSDSEDSYSDSSSEDEPVYQGEYHWSEYDDKPDPKLVGKRMKTNEGAAAKAEASRGKADTAFVVAKINENHRKVLAAARALFPGCELSAQELIPEYNITPPGSTFYGTTPSTGFFTTVDSCPILLVEKLRANPNAVLGLIQGFYSWSMQPPVSNPPPEIMPQRVAQMLYSVGVDPRKAARLPFSILVNKVLAMAENVLLNISLQIDKHPVDINSDGPRSLGLTLSIRTNSGKVVVGTYASWLGKFTVTLQSMQFSITTDLIGGVSSPASHRLRQSNLAPYTLAYGKLLKAAYGERVKSDARLSLLTYLLEIKTDDESKRKRLGSILGSLRSRTRAGNHNGQNSSIPRGAVHSDNGRAQQGTRQRPPVPRPKDA